MIKYGKVWGETRDIFEKSDVSLKHISCKEGFKCSVHKHESKFNQFYVLSGWIFINVWKNDYDLIDYTELGPGDITIVKPGEFHDFEALEDSEVLEIYWVELREDDIVRNTVGGKK